ncbi:MAG TPA: DUF47 family protein [Firmicutes bacterium]|nr:DUF47 family protein [Bacillota bacterium]
MARSKADRFYFENFIEAADCACRAAGYLVECLKKFQPDQVGKMLEVMHEHEHAADQKKHEMTMALAKAFVTPLDREDLAELSQNIDEVTDKIEEILQRFYVDQVAKVTPESIVIAEKIEGCCQLMKDMLTELEHFKKPEKLHEMIVELNHREEDCDRLYLEATRSLKDECSEVMDLFAWREIYDYMEDCVDACEHVADTVEMVVIKNS